jgi:hypothetical protein
MYGCRHLGVHGLDSAVPLAPPVSDLFRTSLSFLPFPFSYLCFDFLSNAELYLFIIRDRYRAFNESLRHLVLDLRVYYLVNQYVEVVASFRSIFKVSISFLGQYASKSVNVREVEHLL